MEGLNFEVKKQVRAYDGDANFRLNYGADQVNFVRTNSNSTASLSNTFRIAVPSQSTLVARRMMLKAQLKVTVNYNGTPTGDFKLDKAYGTTCALNAFPLASCMENLEIQLNSNQINVNMRQQRELLNLQDDVKMSEYNSTVPTTRDNILKYSNKESDIGNVLSGGQNSLGNLYRPRGAYNVVLGTYANQKQTLTFEVEEPLIISPLSYEADGIGKLMSNLNDIVIRIQFAGDSQNVLKMVQPQTSVPAPLDARTTVEVVGQPEITTVFL